MSQHYKWLQIQASQVWNSCEKYVIYFSLLLTKHTKLWKVGRAGNEGSTLRKLQIPFLFGSTAHTSCNKVASFDILSDGQYILNTWTELLLEKNLTSFALHKYTEGEEQFCHQIQKYILPVGEPKKNLQLVSEVVLAFSISVPVWEIVHCLPPVSWQLWEVNYSVLFFSLKKWAPKKTRDPKESSKDSYLDSARPNILLQLPHYFSCVNTPWTKYAPSDVFKKKIEGLTELAVISIWGGEREYLFL